mgnify:CR=1 FL=1
MIATTRVTKKLGIKDFAGDKIREIVALIMEVMGAVTPVLVDLFPHARVPTTSGRVRSTRTDGKSKPPVLIRSLL